VKNILARFSPTDTIVASYCLLTTLLVLFFGRPLGNFADELAFYTGCLALAVFVAMFVNEQSGRAAAFVRLAYPAILFPFFYSMTQGLIFLFTDSFQDSSLVALEECVLSVELTRWFDQSTPSVLITEILSFCYFSYYFMIPGFFLPVFIKRDYRIFKEATAAVCLTFFPSYLLFSIFPIEGPRWHFEGQYAHTIDGPVFRQMVNYVINNGAVHGGCMPSTHTAVALVLMFFCFRYYRPWGWVMLPIVIGLAAATVWGRFHYVSDVIVGAMIGTAAYWIIRKYHSRWTRCDLSNVQLQNMSESRVS
jgi:membrane-associated phospholipid phosphatase